MSTDEDNPNITSTKPSDEHNLNEKVMSPSIGSGTEFDSANEGQDNDKKKRLTARKQVKSKGSASSSSKPSSSSKQENESEELIAEHDFKPEKSSITRAQLNHIVETMIKERMTEMQTKVQQLESEKQKLRKQVHFKEPEPLKQEPNSLSSSNMSEWSFVQEQQQQSSFLPSASVMPSFVQEQSQPPSFLPSVSMTPECSRTDLPRQQYSGLEMPQTSAQLQSKMSPMISECSRTVEPRPQYSGLGVFDRQLWQTVGQHSEPSQSQPHSFPPVPPLFQQSSTPTFVPTSVSTIPEFQPEFDYLHNMLNQSQTATHYEPTGQPQTPETNPLVQELLKQQTENMKQMQEMLKIIGHQMQSSASASQPPPGPVGPVKMKLETLNALPTLDHPSKPEPATRFGNWLVRIELEISTLTSGAKEWWKHQQDCAEQAYHLFLQLSPLQRLGVKN